MPTLADLLIGVLLPACLGLVASWLATARRLHDDHLKPWAGVAALIAGITYALARWLIWGFPSGWPASASDRLAFAGLGLGLVAGIAHALPRWARIVVTVAAPCVAVLILRQWTPDIFLAAGVIGVVALTAEAATRGPSPVTALGALALWAGILAPTFILLAAAKQAQAAGIIAAFVGAAATIALLTRRAPPGLAAWVVSLLGLAHVVDWKIGDQPHLLAQSCLAAAPLALLIDLRQRPWLGIALRSVLLLGLVGCGLGLLYLRQP